MKRLYGVSVQVSLYRGPSYVRSITFRVRPVPQDGLVDDWLEAFAAKLQVVAASLAADEDEMKVRGC